MNTLFQLWHYSLLPSLIWWSVLCALILLLAEWEHWLTPKEQVGRRAALWKLVVAVLALIPISFVLSPLQIRVPGFQPHLTYENRIWESKPSLTTIPPAPTEDRYLRSVIKNPADPFIKWVGFSPRLPQAELPIPHPISILLGVVYIGGVLFFAFRLWRESRRLSRFLADTRPCKDEAILTLAREIRQRLKLRRDIPIRLCEDNVSPFVTVGPRRFMVLPRSLAEQWPPEEIRPILMHEFCHLRHYDPFFETVLQYLRIALWFLPLFSTLGNRLDDTREALCDARAARECPDAKTYAALLVRLAETLLPFPALHVSHPLVQPGSRTLRRLDRLKLQNPEVVAFEYFEQRWGWIGAWALVLVFFGGVTTAAPVLHIFSVIEPHPRTNNEALTLLRGWRKSMEPYRDQIHIEADYRHQLFTPQAARHGDYFPDSTIGLLLDQQGAIEIWRDGNNRRTDLRSRYRYRFHTEEPLDADRPHTLNYSEMFTDDLAYRQVVWTEDGTEKGFTRESYRQHNQPSTTDDFFCEWIDSWQCDMAETTRLVEEGERIATLECSESGKTVVIVPTFGTGREIRFFLPPETDPLPRWIEFREDGLLRDRQEFEYDEKQSLTRFISTRWGRYQYAAIPHEQAELHSIRREYTLRRVEKNPTIPDVPPGISVNPPPSIPDLPNLEVEAMQRLEFELLKPFKDFPAEEFNRRVLATLDDYPHYSSLNGGVEIDRMGNQVSLHLSCSYHQLTDLSAKWDSDRIQCRATVFDYAMGLTYSTAGELRERDTRFYKSSNAVAFSLPGNLRFVWDAVDAPRTPIIKDQPISPTEIRPEYQFIAVGSKGYITLRHFQREDGGYLFNDFGSVSAPTGSRAEYELPFCNTSEKKVHVTLASPDPNVSVELPPGGVIPPHSMRTAKLSALTGTATRQYNILFRTDHDAVREIEFELYVEPK